MREMETGSRGLRVYRCGCLLRLRYDVTSKNNV